MSRYIDCKFCGEITELRQCKDCGFHVCGMCEIDAMGRCCECHEKEMKTIQPVGFYNASLARFEPVGEGK